MIEIHPSLLPYITFDLICPMCGEKLITGFNQYDGDYLNCHKIDCSLFIYRVQESWSFVECEIDRYFIFFNFCTNVMGVRDNDSLMYLSEYLPIPENLSFDKNWLFNKVKLYLTFS